MKPLLLTVLLLFPAIPTLAQVNFSWQDTGPGAISEIRFNCATNDTAFSLVASFRAPPGVESLTSIEAVVDFCTGDQGFPTWWELNSCRNGAMSASIDFTGGPFSFTDYWAGRGSASATFSKLFVNTGRIVVTASIPPGDAGPLVEGLEYYAFKIRIDARKTVGDGNCPGCELSACFVLNDLRLMGPGLDERLHGPMTFYSPAWQGPIPGCPFIVPVESATWSALKTRYR